MLTVVLALIIVGGIDIGLFLYTGESTSNCIAHFGGFITLLVLFLLYDVRMENRRHFPDDEWHGSWYGQTVVRKSPVQPDTSGKWDVVESR